MADFEKIKKIRNIIESSEADKTYLKGLSYSEYDKVENFIKLHKLGIKLEDVVGYYDFALFGGGKKGVILTCDYLYESHNGKDGCKISFEKLHSVSSQKYDLILNYKDGRVEKRFTSIYTDHYCDIISRIIELNNTEQAKVQQEVHKQAQPEVKVKNETIKNVQPEKKKDEVKISSETASDKKTDDLESLMNKLDILLAEKMAEVECLEKGEEPGSKNVEDSVARAREEAEAKRAEEAARQEAEKKAKEEAARLEAEKKAKEEAARLEAEKKAKEETYASNLDLNDIKNRVEKVLSEKVEEIPVKKYTPPVISKKPSKLCVKAMENKLVNAKLYGFRDMTRGSYLINSQINEIKRLLPSVNIDQVIGYYNNNKVIGKQWYVITMDVFYDHRGHRVYYDDIKDIDYNYRTDKTIITSRNGFPLEYTFSINENDIQSCFYIMMNRYATLFDEGWNYAKVKNYEAAYECYLEAAVNGNNNAAQNNLGVLFKDGKVGAADIDAAIYWYEKAANQGNIYAMSNLGGCYREKKIYDKAAYWLKKRIEAKEDGNQNTLNTLGIMYYRGEGVNVDYDEAIRLYQKSADKGNEYANYNLGLAYTYKRIDYEKAFENYMIAAEKGHKSAMNSVGLCYYNGRGVERNYSEAFRWFEKAAQSGNNIALLNIGTYHCEVNHNFDTAMEWYQKAIDAGWDNAYSCIGRMYKEGEWIQQDYGKAIEWFEKGIEAGNNLSMNQLGKMYKEGAGVPVDYGKAVELFVKAMEKESEDGLVNLALMYLEGLGVPQDFEMANRLLDKALKKESTYAKYHLACMYIDGTYCEQDIEKGVSILYDLVSRIGFDDSKLAKKKLIELLLDQVISLSREDIKEFLTFADDIIFEEPSYVKQKEALEQYLYQYILETTDPKIRSVMLKNRYTYPITEVEATLQVAADALERMDYEEAIHYYTYAWDEGNVYAAFALAKLYMDQKEADLENAEVWAEKAKEKGHPYADELLNIIWHRLAIYNREIMTKKNNSVFLNLFLKSKMGYFESMLESYYDEEVQFHSKIVCKYYEKLANIGDAWSAYWLALYFAESANDVERLEKSVYWSKRAEELGDPQIKEFKWHEFLRAVLQLEKQYSKSNDIAKQKRFYKIMADYLEDPMGMYNMAVVHFNNKEYNEALSWINKAMEKGYNAAESDQLKKRIMNHIGYKL